MSHPDVQQKALTLRTAQTFSWDVIGDSMVSQGLTAYKSGDSNEGMPNDYGEKVSLVFDAFDQECKRVIGPLRTQVTVALWILLPTLAVAMVGGTLLAVMRNIWVGSTLSTASFVGIFGCIWQGWRLGVDQAMLEIIPATYRAQFSLCKTDAQFQLVFDSFLRETQQLRRNLTQG